MHDKTDTGLIAATKRLTREILPKLTERERDAVIIDCLDCNLKKSCTLKCHKYARSPYAKRRLG